MFEFCRRCGGAGCDACAGRGGAMQTFEVGDRAELWGPERVRGARGYVTSLRRVPDLAAYEVVVELDTGHERLAVMEWIVNRLPADA